MAAVCHAEGAVSVYDVIIIGGGPAGLSAAIYAGRAGLTCLVVEKTGLSGGQALYAERVENYPGIIDIEGGQLAESFKLQASQLGAQFVPAGVKEISCNYASGSVQVILTDGTTLEAADVILAMGADRRKLGVPGEERLRGKGVSYCATCDGAFYRNKTVCVIGGGDSAAGEALYLANICKRVYLIHRRAELRAANIIAERIMAADNIEVLFNTAVIEIEGARSVESVRVNDVVMGAVRSIKTDGVFIAVGMQPQTSILKNMDKIELDENGYIIAGEDGRTGMKHVYAAGDIRKKPLRQIITAAADGANCINSIEEDAHLQ